VLIESQIKEGCAAGSWDPWRPTKESIGDRGGRLCVTGLATLTLEVYYRYLPLYKLDNESDLNAPSAGPAVGPEAAAKPGAAPAAKEEKPAAKPEAKPEEKPAAKPETKPPAGKPAAAAKEDKPAAGKPKEAAAKAKAGKAKPATEKKPDTKKAADQ